MCVPICRVTCTCVWKKFIVIFHTTILEIIQSHPRYHIYAIISSVVITDWPCVATYQMYFVWSARRCLDPHWLRAAQSNFGTAPAPGHVRQVNNLVFWIDGATATRGQLGGRIRPVRWRKWNRIRIDLARLADPIPHTSIWVRLYRWRGRCLLHYDV